MRDRGCQEGSLLRSALTVVLAVVVLPACGETVTQIGPDDVVNLRIIPDSAQLAIGRTLQFRAFPLDETGALVVGQNISWQSTDPAVASIDGSGLATGVSSGVVEIVASVAGFEGLASLAVAEPPRIVLSADSVYFEAAAGGADPEANSIDLTNGGAFDLVGLAIDSIVYGSGATGWLVAQLGSSAAPATLTFSALTAGVTTAGTYLATLWVSGPDADDSPAAVQVTLRISAGSPAAVTVDDGDGQTASAGTAVPIAPSVLIADAFGNPVGGEAVTFSVTGGGGSLTGGSATSDASGVARVGSWTLGTTAGANTLSAAVAGAAPAVITATGVAGAATSLALSAGDNQSAVVGSSVAVPPTVVASDDFGNAVDGVSVTFAVTSGGGSVTGASPSTDATGVAVVGSWTLGPTIGPNTLLATAPGVADSVTFSATGLAGPAAVIQLESGDAQVDTVAATLPVAYTVRIGDANGNRVPGVTVTWAVTGGGGSIGTLSSTDASGIATATHTFGTTSGAQTATASITGLSGSPVTFTSTATVGAPTFVVEAGGDGQSATVGTPVMTAPAVLVSDQFANPAVGAQVTFTVTGGGGSVSGATPTTDATGTAQVGDWTLGTTTGVNTLSATVGALTPVVFSAAAVAGAATQLNLDGGDGQSAVAGAAVAVPPSVAAQDQFGNGVQGVTVQFEVTAGGGAVTGATPVTPTDGIAAVGSWTLGATAGPNTLLATSPGIADSITFDATGLGGAAVAMSLDAGDAQTDTVGATLPTAYSARVVDMNANGVSGIPVSWTVTGGGGSITTSSVTGVDGIATATRVLGTTAGAQTATASVGGLTGSPVSFTATATAGAPALASIGGGDGQSATVNTTLATAPSIVVTDQFGNPTSGVAVSFAVTAGGGSVTGAARVTDGSGVAMVGSWTLGTTAGANGLAATPTGIAAVPFTATGTADAASQLLLDTGDGQSATAGSPVAIEPAVQVLDQFDNTVQGATVTFEVASGGGSVTGATPSSLANGIATVGSWTLGGPVGPNTLLATVVGVADSVTFTATGSVGPAASMSLNAGDSQTDTVAATLATAYSALVVDSNGNPVSGTTVSWSVTGGGGSITLSSDTDPSGIAFAIRVLGTTAGPQTARAAVGGLTGSPVAFTATATAGAAATITGTAGDGQTRTVNTAVTVPPRVSVVDRFGNAVGGHSVTFSVTAGGGTVSPSTPILTAADGTATVTTWTLGTAAGTNNNRLAATGAGGGIGGNPVRFTASSTAAAPASIRVQSGNGQTATTGVNVANMPTALVEDQFGNPVLGATVDFSATGGGSPGSGTVTTNTSGLAATTWTLSTAGHAMGTDGRYANTLMARVRGTVFSTIFSGFAIYSFQTHVNPLWAAEGCTGCHGGTSGLFLNGTVAANYAALVQPANCYMGADSSVRRVSRDGGVVADTSRSVVMRMVDPALPLATGCTSSAASMTMGATSIEIIRAWIRNGAPPN